MTDIRCGPWIGTAAAADLMPARIPVAGPEPLATARTVIRLLAESDLRALMALYGDDRVTRFLPYATWRSAADAEAWCRQILRMPARPYVIVDSHSAGVIGTCFLFGYQALTGAARLGYALVHSHWGKGYMREALEAIATSAFLHAGLRRLYADVDRRNIRSANLLKSLGFGLLADPLSAPAASGDRTVVQRYCLLRGEWRQTEGRTPARG